MIFRIVGHKGLGLVAAFLNVVLAAEVLPEASSVYYLASFSFIQIMMAFAGFGVAHKLVTHEDEQAMKAKTSPWFLASIIFGWGLFALQSIIIDAPHKYPILLFVCLALALTILSEWIRCAIARHSGFVIYNVMILCTAIGILATKDFPYWLSLLPGGGIVLLFALEFRGIEQSGKLVSPGFSDLIRAARVASVNQFYNVIIFLLSMTSGMPELLMLILVYRFNIFFNWQSFYWLRFGHKKTANGIEASHRKENWKTIYLNIAALAGIAAASGIVLLFDNLQQYLGNVFNADFLVLLLFYATIRVLVNLMFPYELFLIYGTELKTDLKLVSISLLTFILIGLFAFFVHQLFWIIIFVEVSWFSWRLYSRQLLSSRSPAV